jgi:undecaprenyl phosphate N,N'-diacetylbacillosamine 1-phosphate transferase
VRPSYLIKRALDYAVAGVILGGTAPLMGAIAAAIRLDSRGPALFVQDRVGRDGRPYRMYKFRTMRTGAPLVLNPDGSTRADSSDQRITRVGRLLRGGLDELPQLLNVLRGEMSLVGPRPELTSQAHLYSEAERDKLAVLPGITSLAAVLGRNEIPWKERIGIDLRYIRRWRLGLDLKIMLQTVLLPLGVHPFTFEDVLNDDQ